MKIADISLSTAPISPNLARVKQKRQKTIWGGKAERKTGETLKFSDQGIAI